MKNIIIQKYYRYNPGEFLPIYEGGQMVNIKEFHRYRIRQILQDPKGAVHYFTHFTSTEA